MIYILGMSHIRPVLDACSVNGIDEQLSKIVNDNEPIFADWETKMGILPDRVKAASIYIAQIAPHWGGVLALQLEPTVIRFAPGYRNFLGSIEPDNGKSVLFVFMHGEEHIHMGMREYQVPYDFYIPWRPDLPILPQRQVIPLDIIERQVALHLTKSIANFNVIRLFHPELRIVNVICPPPPCRQNFWLIPNNTEIALREKLSTAACNNNSIRLKYYLLYVKALREAISPLGIESLMPPSEAVTPDGLLRPEYVGDNVHGNTLYGSQVLAQMNELLLTGVC